MSAMMVVWAVLFVVALIIEARTSELISIWFVPGTLISLVLSFFDVDVWIQWLVFGAVSAILLVLAFTVFRKKLLKNHGSEATDTDLLLGKEARVEEDINNAEMCGSVKIDGKIWSARMEDDSESATAGEFVTVVRISGVKLICKRK